MQLKTAHDHQYFKAGHAPSVLDFFQTKPGRQKIWRGPGLVAAVAALTIFYNAAVTPAPGYCQPAEAAAPPAPMVITSVVTEKTVNPPEEYVGRVEAVQSVDLRARVEGFLEEVRFKEGAMVKAGDVLYVIEQTAYKAKVKADQARVARAQATLSSDIKYLKRLKSVNAGGVSATDLETAESRVQQSRAALQEAQASLASSQLNLSYTTIKAPIDGQIGKTKYTRGNLVNPSSGVLASIVQSDPVRVVFSISENKMPEKQKKRLDSSIQDMITSRKFQIRLPDQEIYPEPGQPDFMDNQVDSKTGTLAAYLKFDNPSHFLVPGQYVTVLESSSNPKKKPVIPQASVLEDRDGRYVFVVTPENKAEQRRIITGPVMGTMWSVESGLRIGEKIIVQGVQKVKPGQMVAPQAAEQIG